MNTMNHSNHDNENLDEDSSLVSKVVSELRQPLNLELSAQLKAARHLALTKSARKPLLPSLVVWGVPTLASVVAIAVSFSIWQAPEKSTQHLDLTANVVLEDIPILKGSDDLEFYQNLELLHWMEQVDNGLTKG